MADPFDLYPRPPAANPLVLSDPVKAIGLLNALNTNRLQSQEIFARDSAADVYKGAIGPDGKPNPLIMGDRINQGAGGYLAPQLMSTINSQEMQRIAQDTAKIQQAELSRGIWNSMVGSLNPKMNPEQARAAIVKQSTMFPPGVLPSSFLNGQFRSMEKDGVAATIANATRQATGAEKLGGPAGEVLQPGSTGRETISQGEFQQRRFDEQSGRIPAAPGTTPAPASSLPRQSPTATTPPIGTERSSALLQEDLSRAANFGQEMYPWMQALEKVKALGPGGTAPGSKGRQELESFVYGLSPEFAKIIPGFDVSKIKNYAELEKYLTQATQTRAAQLGVKTDQGLATAIAGNPNVHINDLAVTDVVKSAIALRRMEHAQTLVNEGAGPVGYSAMKSKWPTTQDPAAYAIDLMEPDARTKYIKALKGPALERFNRSLEAAYASGVIDRPRKQ